MLVKINRGIQRTSAYLVSDLKDLFDINELVMSFASTDRSSVCVNLKVKHLRKIYYLECHVSRSSFSLSIINRQNFEQHSTLDGRNIQIDDEVASNWHDKRQENSAIFRFPSFNVNDLTDTEILTVQHRVNEICEEVESLDVNFIFDQNREKLNSQLFRLSIERHSSTALKRD